MSIRYRNGTGQEIIAAGLTPGGNVEAGAVAEVRGSFTVPSTETNRTSTVDVIFPDSFEMPSNDYIVSFDTSTNVPFIYTVYQKTTTGFTVKCFNAYNEAVTATTNYICTKTYTVQHDVQNSEAIATIQQSIPAGAGSGNQLTTKSYVDNADNALDIRLDNLEDLVPVGASISNQLVTASQASVDNALSATSEHAVQNKVVKAAIDAKQDTLTFDNVPTENSTNPVKSGGVYNEEQKIWNVINTNGAKNLLPYPYDQTTTTSADNFTFTDVGDGTVKISGTASSNRFFKLYDTNPFATTGRYILSGGLSSNVWIQLTNTNGNTVQYNGTPITCIGDGSIAFDIEQLVLSNGTAVAPKDLRIYLSVKSGEVGNNRVFKPMLRLADDANEIYQPYAETNYQLTQDKISYADNGILGAKNLLPNNGLDSLTATGVTFTKNANGTVTINGTATAYTLYNLFVNNASFVVENKNGLIVSALQNGVTLRVKDSDETWYGSSTREVIVPAGKNIVAGSIAVGNGTTLNNYTVGPMLRCISDPDPTYQPYAMTNRELTDSVSKMTWKTIATASSVAASGTAISLNVNAIHSKQDVRVTFYSNNARIQLTQYGSSSTAREYRGSVVSPDSSANRLGFILRWKNADLNTCTITYYANGTASALNTAISIQVWE